MMDAWEIIERIAKAEKKTPVRVFLREKEPVDYGTAEVFGPGDKVLFGDWRELGPILAANREKIDGLVVEWDRRNSALPLLDRRDKGARVSVELEGAVLAAFPAGEAAAVALPEEARGGTVEIYAEYTNAPKQLIGYYNL